MSIQLHEPTESSDRLHKDSRHDAQTAGTFILRRETELRTRIARLIAGVSKRENWKLKQCAAVARRVEQISIAHLETIRQYFEARGERHTKLDTPDVLADVLPTSSRAAHTPVADLHDRMHTLELRVANGPGLSCGIQGVRIMRVVALMSQARVAKMKGGNQAIYRHH